MSNSTRQKHDLQSASDFLQQKINEMQKDQEILKLALEAIENENIDILESDSKVANDARKVMYKLSQKHN